MQSTEGIQKMEIKRSGSQPSGKGPAEYFTGTVRIDPLFQAPDPARVLGASVTFEPGARTARSEEHTSELQSLAYLVCRLLLEKKKISLHVRLISLSKRL